MGAVPAGAVASVYGAHLRKQAAEEHRVATAEAVPFALSLAAAPA